MSETHLKPPKTTKFLKVLVLLMRSPETHGGDTIMRTSYNFSIIHALCIPVKLLIKIVIKFLQ